MLVFRSQQTSDRQRASSHARASPAQGEVDGGTVDRLGRKYVAWLFT